LLKKKTDARNYAPFRIRCLPSKLCRLKWTELVAILFAGPSAIQLDTPTGFLNWLIWKVISGNFPGKRSAETSEGGEDRVVRHDLDIDRLPVCGRGNVARQEKLDCP